MGYPTVQSSEVWALAARQHGVVSRVQLLELGVSAQGIKHRVATGRLHPVQRCVYAVGRAQITHDGHLIAATMTCGPDAVISHGAAAGLWEMTSGATREIDVSVPLSSRPRRGGIRVHRRAALAAGDVATHHGIAVTTPLQTLLDIAPRLTREKLEAAINAADKRDLTDPEALRSALLARANQPGVAKLREVLDRRTFALTDSELERRFLPLVRAAGLPAPRTGQWVTGFKVDFHWPDLGLVVETAVCATTARRHSRPGIVCATRRTPRPV